MRKRLIALCLVVACCLPALAAQIKLVELKVKGLPIWRKWYVVLHKGKRLSVAAEEFRSLLINESVGLLQH